MKRLLKIFLLVFCVFSCGKLPDEGPDVDVKVRDGVSVYGYVTSDGRGISGVVVSDGVEVTTTGPDGRYELESGKGNGYVFISVPSGYESDSDGVLPRFFVHCSSPADKAERCDFHLREVDQSEYRMLAFGDMHLANRSFCKDFQQFHDFSEEINMTSSVEDIPQYALTLGDMTWDVYWEQNSFGLTDYILEIQKDFKGMQLFHTMGNHDNDPSQTGDGPGESTYRKILGPNYYSFNVGKVHYIVLDDIMYKNEPAGTRDFFSEVTEAQLEWMKKDLQYVRKSTPVVVAMHSPLYRRDGSGALSNLGAFIRCFDGYDYVQILSAHMHNVYDVDMLSRSIHIFESNSGAVCGAWWMTDIACESGMHLCSDGAPGGYRILDVKGDDIRWTYKGTDCPEDYQFRTYDRNEICFSADKYVPHASLEGKKEFLSSVGEYSKKSSANQVLINIWDYDPSWKISVKENGRSLKVTKLSDVKDPLYLLVYEAYEHEHGYSVSYPAALTDHIFSVYASGPDTTLEIEITDRFGHKYSETMTRPKAFVPENY